MLHQTKSISPNDPSNSKLQIRVWGAFLLIFTYHCKVLDKSSIPTVTVLLATFNGETFLEEQLASLACQRNVLTRIIVNDDGSTDNTIEMLEKWKELGLITKVSSSNQIGASKAFQKLLMENLDSDYIAFCDQDDVWEPNKLTEQLELMLTDSPTLVFTKRVYITKEGNVFKKQKEKIIIPSFRNALVENVCPGNTILINRSAAAKLSSFYRPEIGHYDAWFYLIMSATSNTSYLNKELVKYRIHEDNVVGTRSAAHYSVFQSVRNYFTNASTFRELNLDVLTEIDEQYFVRFLSLVHEKKKLIRLRNLLRIQLFRQKRKDSIVMKAVIFLGILFNKL